jgi:hypothetical protein
MLSRFRRSLGRSVGRFFNKSSKINQEPINSVSLTVLILVDLFILVNVFAGLDNISYWPISPTGAYPCQSPWQEYRTSTAADKDFSIVNSAFASTALQSFPTIGESHLGEVSEICLEYKAANEKIASPANREILKRINDTQAEINSFTASNATIRQQYDSTLLEEIAGQPRDQSINNVEASQARQKIASNDAAIAQRKQTLATLKSQLTAAPESKAFLALLADGNKFSQVDKGYQRASFWYPSIQLFFQGLFLLPLIVIAWAVHRFAQRRRYGYVALISWHMLAIFFIPLIWKIFEFLQVGFLFQLLAQLIETLFGSLRFLLNYLQILLIPLLGFGIIKFAQKFVFNPRLQAANRVQNQRCIHCAKRLQRRDIHCPHCNYPQFHDCHNCHNLTYQHLPFCRHCGAGQPLDL